MGGAAKGGGKAATPSAEVEYRVAQAALEDDVFVAANVATPELYKAWTTQRGASPRPTENHLVLELPQPTQICGLRLTNLRSAFVEVEVALAAGNAAQWRPLLPNKMLRNRLLASRGMDDIDPATVGPDALVGVAADLPPPAR